MAAKIEVLELFDRLQLVGALDLMNEFKYSEKFARTKLTRLHKQGLTEPAITEKGKWILSVKGEKRLQYFRRTKGGGEKGGGTGSPGG